MFPDDNFVTLRRHQGSKAPRNSIAKRLSVVPGKLAGLPLYIETKPFECEAGTSVTKLAESTFAEVFLERNGTLILKVMPLAGPTTYLDAQMDLPVASDWQSIDHERQVFEALAGLTPFARYNVPNSHTGFSLLHSFEVLEGTWSQSFLDAWDNWNMANKSHCKDPRQAYSSASAHAVFKMQFAGEELDNLELSADQIDSVIRQVCYSLAKAERVCDFEHRDLYYHRLIPVRHLGNVLVKETPMRTIKLYDFPSFKSFGILCTIIDFSLSSVSIRGKRIHRDLHKDLWLFEPSVPDGPVSDQQRVYAMMRDVSDGNWAGKYLRTNVLWIGYIIGELLKRLPKSSIPRELAALRDRLPGVYDSVGTLVSSDPFFVAK